MPYIKDPKAFVAIPINRLLKKPKRGKFVVLNNRYWITDGDNVFGHIVDNGETIRLMPQSSNNRIYLERYIKQFDDKGLSIKRFNTVYWFHDPDDVKKLLSEHQYIDNRHQV